MATLKPLTLFPFIQTLVSKISSLNQIQFNTFKLNSSIVRSTFKLSMLILRIRPVVHDVSLYRLCVLLLFASRAERACYSADEQHKKKKHIRNQCHIMVERCNTLVITFNVQMERNMQWSGCVGEEGLKIGRA